MTQSTKPAMIQVEATINAPIEKVWKFWTEPAHITRWCQASDDWHAPEAENDLRTGGKFKTVMAAKDGSVSFPFEGEYILVKHHETINYKMADGREVHIAFVPTENTVHIVERFDPETQNPHEMQKTGWQGIMNNFKKHVEEN